MRDEVIEIGGILRHEKPAVLPAGASSDKLMCKIRGLGFTEDEIDDPDEKFTRDIKKHIYPGHSISFHLSGQKFSEFQVRTSTSMTTTTSGTKMTTIGIFVSSVQKELNEERTAIRDYIKTDPLLRIYFEPFLFENIPATDRDPEELYLSEVDGCSIYLGIFGNAYGQENKQGISPVEREFERATE